MNPCGRAGPCHCAVCNLTRVAEHDASTAAYCRQVGDVPRAERYEADVARTRRALARVGKYSDAPPGVRAASSRP